MDRIRRHLDRLGISLSILCLLQCLLLPVAAIAMPTLAGSFLSDEFFHQLLVWFILPVSLLAFGIGAWRHRHHRVLIPAVLGLACIITAVLLGHDGVLGELGSRAMTLIGAGLLAIAHVANYRLCRSDLCSGHHH